MARHGLKTHFYKIRWSGWVEDTLENNPTLKAIYLETPSNPTLDCVDLQAVANLIKSRGIITIIDNNILHALFAATVYGIDFIIHSSTKYLNGHGNSISGIILVNHPNDEVK